MKITAIHHAQITVPVGMEDAARRFYVEVLGLTVTPKPPHMAVRGGFWLQVGAQQVHVNTEDNDMRARSRAHVAYQVDDLRAARTELATHGIDVIHGDGIPGYIRCELRDPFGNRIELIQAVS